MEADGLADRFAGVAPAIANRLYHTVYVRDRDTFDCDSTRLGAEIPNVNFSTKGYQPEQGCTCTFKINNNYMERIKYVVCDTTVEISEREGLPNFDYDSNWRESLNTIPYVYGTVCWV